MMQSSNWNGCSVTSHAAGIKQRMVLAHGIFLTVILGTSNALPSLHPAIWNHDGMKGGSLLGLHEYNNEDQEEEPLPRGGGGRNGEDGPSRIYIVQGDYRDVEAPYENTVNPFLSHIEQGWRLKPVKHHYMRKKLLQSAGMSPQQQQKMASINSYADELFGPLPMNPNRTHFVESVEDGEEPEEENRDFGDEEKDLGDMLHVLLSPDY